MFGCPSRHPDPEEESAGLPPDGPEGRRALDEDIVELDIRPLHPSERHDRIFSLWNALKPGQTLRLTNDHNPKPLRYQFEAEYKGLFEWTSLQEGPKDWIFAIRRLHA